MRIILGIVIVTILVAVAWSVEPTTANQRPNRAIDPVGMMLTTKTCLQRNATGASELHLPHKEAFQIKAPEGFRGFISPTR